MLASVKVEKKRKVFPQTRTNSTGINSDEFVPANSKYEYKQDEKREEVLVNEKCEPKWEEKRREVLVNWKCEPKWDEKYQEVLANEKCDHKWEEERREVLVKRKIRPQVPPNIQSGQNIYNSKGIQKVSLPTF